MSDPPSPPAFGPPQEPQQSGEQAEVDAVLARRVTGQPVLVAGYRFTGPNHLNNDSSAPLDIVYSGDSDASVAFLRGSSIMGWSYSLNGGLTWLAPGKIYSEYADGDQVAIIWSDPALASGFVNRSLVAYASLAVSKESFDAVTSGTDTEDILFGWPPSVKRPDGYNIVDSICVALSLDGGISFERPACKRPEGIGPAGTDQTSVAVDALDRVFVAVDDFANDALLLYRLQYIGVATAHLEPVSVPPEMAVFSHGPELRRDQAGVVWLAGVDSAGRIGLCLVGPNSCTFVGVVTTDTDYFASLPAGVVSPQPLRSGSSADFGVSRVQVSPGITAREFVFAYTRMATDPPRPVASLTRCFLFSLGGSLSCEDIGSWGTAGRVGHHLQPNVEVVDKSVAQDGSAAEWRYGFYEFARPEIAPGRAQVTLGRLSGTLPSAGPLGVSFDPLHASDPRVCPAHYPATDYWGDYFALVGVPPIAPSTSWRHVAIYSSDEGRGCAPSHPRQGRNLHLVSWSWED